MDGAGVCVAWMILESRNYNYTNEAQAQGESNSHYI